MELSNKRSSSLSLGVAILPNLFLWSGALLCFRISVFSFNQQVRGLSTLGFLFWLVSTLLVLLSVNALRKSGYSFTVYKRWDRFFTALLLTGFFALFVLSFFLSLPTYFSVVLFGLQFFIFKYVTSFRKPKHLIFLEGIFFFCAFMTYVFLDVGVVMIAAVDTINDIYRQKIVLFAVAFSLVLMFLIWVYRLLTLGFSYIPKGRAYFYLSVFMSVVLYLYFLTASIELARYFLTLYVSILLIFPLLVVLFFAKRNFAKILLQMQMTFHCLILPYIAFFET